MADSPSDRPAEPRVSIIIPIYNEEAILQSAVVDLVDRLSELDEPYELILAENGSTDDTVKIANELAERFPQLVVRSLGQPNYGEALKRGILEARQFQYHREGLVVYQGLHHQILSQ